MVWEGDSGNAWFRPRVFIVVEIIIVQGAHMVIYRLTRVFNMRLLSRLLVKTIAVALSNSRARYPSQF